MQEQHGNELILASKLRIASGGGQVDSLSRSRAQQHCATGDHFGGVKLFNYPCTHDDAPFRRAALNSLHHPYHSYQPLAPAEPVRALMRTSAMCVERMVCSDHVMRMRGC